MHPVNGLLEPFLSQLGISPADNPGEWDRLQREATVWWDGGGSMRAFVAHHREVRQKLADAELARPLTGPQAMMRLYARRPVTP